MVFKWEDFKATPSAVGPGSIFFYGSNDEHGMKNVGATPPTCHVFRIVTEAPPPLPQKT